MALYKQNLYKYKRNSQYAINVVVSVVARPILVVGSKSNSVHQGRAVQQNDSCLDMRPSLLKCNLGEIRAGQHSLFAQSAGRGRPASPAVATTLVVVMLF